MKQISEKLAISVHTVNDYTKILHRRLEVNSRSELLNKCRSRRPSRILALPSGMQDPVWPA
jgi:DNA-binding CsgD family transcriptional regulator